MAEHLPASAPANRKLRTPLTLTQLRALVGPRIEFVELTSGDLLAVNKDSLPTDPINHEATLFAARLGPIRGDVVLFSSLELA